MFLLNIISLIILFIGGINWGLVGIFRFNLVEWIFGGYNAGSIVIYVLVLISTIWLIFKLMINGAIYLRDRNRNN
jgi:uncharacterized membrane protein YuzA (DUF378 family)